MNYKVYLYVICLFACAYAVSGLNFEVIIKRNKLIEARFLAMIFSLSLAYLVANFIINFIEFSKII